MKEMTLGQPALEMIPIDRNLPAPVKTEKRKDPRPIRKKRNRAVRGWAILSGALMALCTIQWIAIYLMLPSVIQSVH